METSGVGVPSGIGCHVVWLLFVLFWVDSQVSPDSRRCDPCPRRCCCHHRAWSTRTCSRTGCRSWARTWLCRSGRRSARSRFRIARTPEFAGDGGSGRRVDDIHGVGPVEDDPRSFRVPVRVLVDLPGGNAGLVRQITLGESRRQGQADEVDVVVRAHVENLARVCGVDLGPAGLAADGIRLKQSRRRGDECGCAADNRVLDVEGT